MTGELPHFTKLVDNANAYLDHAKSQKDKAVDDAEAAQSGGRTMLLTLGLFGLVLCGAIAFLLARGISRGIGQMVTAAEGIAEGDVDQRIDVKSKDEIGTMAGAFTRMVEYLKGIGAAADRVAAGDLTVDVEAKSERDLLGNAFQRMTVNLRELVGSVAGATEQVVTASQQMAATSEEAGKAVGEIASAVGDVAQGAERQVRRRRAVKASADGGRDRGAHVGASRPRRPPRWPSRRASPPARASAPPSRRPRRCASVARLVAGGHRRDPRAGRQVGARSARSSRRSPASPGRRTCWRSTRRSRPRVQASRAAASPSSPRRSASWPRSRRRRPGRSAA